MVGVERTGTALPRGRKEPDTDLLTAGERRVLELSGELVVAFKELPVLHPLDLPELVRDVHDIQNRLLARVSYRLADRKGESDDTGS